MPDNEVRINLAHAYREAAEQTEGRKLSRAEIQMMLDVDLRSRATTNSSGSEEPRQVLILSDDLNSLSSKIKTYGPLTYDPVTRVLTRGKMEVSMREAMANLFHPLIAFPGRILTYQIGLQLLNYSPNHDRQPVRVSISRLRERINDERLGGPNSNASFTLIQTQPGLGYYLKAKPAA